MAVVEELQPEVVLVDLGLPDGSGLELIAHIHQHMPGCESMVLTVFGDESHVISSIEAGATGYLTKDTRTADILDRLKQLRRWLSNKPCDCQAVAEPVSWGAHTRSTPYQQNSSECDSHLVRNANNRCWNGGQAGAMQAEIADILGVSINTISTYIKRIYKKLAVNSRTSAVHRANALGLINLKDC